MKTILFQLLPFTFFLLTAGSSFSQIGVNTDGTAPNSSAMLDVKSTTKGMLVPRMTELQRTGISSPATGLMVYQTDGSYGFYYYDGTNWIAIKASIQGSIGNVMDVDGNVYSTIIIGNQEWMAENLRVTHYSNGEDIPYVTDPTDWTNLTSGGYCWVAGNIDYKIPYGALYNFYAVDDSRSICPTGWHVPDVIERNVLETYLGGFLDAGGKMKTASSWLSPNTGANNSSGFAGLPGGRREETGTLYTNFLARGYWWTSTGTNPQAYGFELDWNSASVGSVFSTSWRFGFSVRCLRD